MPGPSGLLSVISEAKHSSRVQAWVNQAPSLPVVCSPRCSVAAAQAFCKAPVSSSPPPEILKKTHTKPQKRNQWIFDSRKQSQKALVKCLKRGFTKLMIVKRLKGPTSSNKPFPLFFLWFCYCHLTSDGMGRNRHLPRGVYECSKDFIESKAQLETVFPHPRKQHKCFPELNRTHRIK